MGNEQGGTESSEFGESSGLRNRVSSGNRVSWTDLVRSVWRARTGGIQRSSLDGHSSTGGTDLVRSVWQARTGGIQRSSLDGHSSTGEIDLVESIRWSRPDGVDPMESTASIKPGSYSRFDCVPAVFAEVSCCACAASSLARTSLSSDWAR